MLTKQRDALAQLIVLLVNNAAVVCDLDVEGSNV